MLHRSLSLVGRLCAVAVALLACLYLGSSCGKIDAPVDGDGDADGDADGSITCVADSECDDFIACTIDHCEEDQCEHVACLDCCPDGNECIVGFGCGQPPTPCTVDSECSDDTPCTLDRCRDGEYCEHLPQNGLCEEDEICLAALGCIPSPPSECDLDEDCDMGRPCLGEWYCDPEFACQFLSLVDCDDDDDCTDDICNDEEGGCTNPIRDRDDDGHGDEACGGDDCDDSDPDVSPSADELCNARDDDCDGVVDENCCDDGGPCTTECGTEGALRCDPESGEAECIPPAETCNAADDDCDGEIDEGFECSPVGRSEDCVTTCGSAGVRECLMGCAWDRCVPPDETCNGADDDCDGDTDEGFACAAGEESSCTTACFSTGSRVCLGDCSWDTCAPPAEICNGVDDDCDGVVDDGFFCSVGEVESCTLPAHGFIDGDAVCADDCASWDESACHNCGDGHLDADEGEECDASDLGDQDCFTVSDGEFGGGTLQCGTGCVFDTSLCHGCGNDRIDADEGEDCDGEDLGGVTCATHPGGFDDGILACRFDCRFDTSDCTGFDPDGTYTLEPQPSYRCANWIGIWLVDFSVPTMTFSDSGAELTVSSGAPCLMRGVSVEVSRHIDVTCTLPGSCAETYSLVGDFTDEDTWTGTFTASFSGSCLDCTNQSWTVTGTR